ncbi:MAG: bifunctional ornithine acetyltransferase/N-acetylglutamate synthase, partial [Nitrospinales bacterium]
VDISLNSMPLVKRGAPEPKISQKGLERSMKKKSIVIDIHLGSGNQSVEVYTCDLSYDYVKINAEYTS